MPFDVETTSSASVADSPDGNLTVSHTLVAANKLVATICTGSSNTRNVTNVTWNGTALTQVAESDDGNFEHAEIWELHNPAIGTFNLVITTDAIDNDCEIAVGATGLLGAASAVKTPNTNTGASANPSVTVVDSAAGDIVISVLASDTGPFGSTTANGTQLWEVEDLATDSDYSAQQQTASGASTVCSWTSPASEDAGEWCNAGVAFSAGGQPIYDNASTSDVASGTSLTFSHTTSGSNRGLLVGVTVFISGGSPSATVTYGGVSMSIETSAFTANDAFYIFKLENPAVGANDVVVTASGMGEIVAAAVSVKDCNQADMTTGSLAPAQEGSPHSIDVPSNFDDLVVDFVITFNNVPTVNAAQAQRVSNNNGSSVYSIWASTRYGTAETTTMTWTSGGQAIHFAASVAALSGASPGPNVAGRLRGFKQQIHGVHEDEGRFNESNIMSWY